MVLSIKNYITIITSLFKYFIVFTRLLKIFFPWSFLLIAFFAIIFINFIGTTNITLKDNLKIIYGLSPTSNHDLFSISNLGLSDNDNTLLYDVDLTSTKGNKTHIENLNNDIPTNDNQNTSGTSISKVVILSLDDGKKGDFTYAKPILDKYGFKATFFITCGFVSQQNNDSMNWQEVNALAKDGMDIESHTMSHPHLSELSQVQLEYEIGGSKRCIDSHGYNTTVFAYPYNDGSNNATVVNTVAKYYDIARTGSEPLMFLDCQGFEKHNQKDCSTINAKGKLNFANRFDARSYTVDRMEMKNSFDEAKIFTGFVDEVNSQTAYNRENGKMMAVPLITFHDVGPALNTDYVTNSLLFDKMMKYLHDNDFQVLTFKQLGYNSTTNEFRLKEIN